MGDLLGTAIGKEPERWNRNDETRIGQIMHRLGWVKRRKQINKERLYLYEREDCHE